MRTFIGLSLPEKIRDSIARICYGIEGARWVPEENFHVTLVFLGELDSTEFDSLREICTNVSAGSFPLKADGLGWFGFKKPAILYIACDPDPRLLNLQKTLESGCKRAGFSVEKREYKPHITIARFRDSAQRSVMTYLEEFRDFTLPVFEPGEFHIYSSRSGTDGPIYRIEESFPIGRE